MTTHPSNPVLIRFQPLSSATVRLVCIPHAGGAASTFRMWNRLPSIDVVVAQLPGRETLIAQQPLNSIDAMVEGLLPEVIAHGDLPFAIFGHSMGALVAFEVARALRREGLRSPVHLFVSASRPPRMRDDGLPLMHALPDEDLLSELQIRYGGVPAAVREHRELMELLLPMLRADITALETYARRDTAPLDCPITAFAGSRDARAEAPVMAGWRSETSGAFRTRTFDGDHFFLTSQRDAILREISDALFPAALREGVA